LLLFRTVMLTCTRPPGHQGLALSKGVMTGAPTKSVLAKAKRPKPRRAVRAKMRKDLSVEVVMKSGRWNQTDFPDSLDAKQWKTSFITYNYFKAVLFKCLSLRGST
jgi:hypothetical protein